MITIDDSFRHFDDSCLAYGNCNIPHLLGIQQMVKRNCVRISMWIGFPV